MTEKSIAVIYHYFEKNETYKNNLIFFLGTAICDNIVYYIVISGNCSVSLPKSDNINYIYVENKNNDFGGYSTLLKSLKVEYDFYLFVNSSVRGPFIADYYEGRWVDVFVNKLKDNTHLVGGSVNILPNSSAYYSSIKKLNKYSPPFNHVQTTAYALTGRAINYLLSIDFYDNTKIMTKDEVVEKYEIAMSMEIAKNGWSFTSLMPLYNNIDFTQSYIFPINHSSSSGDILHKQSYYARTLNPTELIFIKTNRDMLTDSELASYTFLKLHAIKNKIQYKEAIKLHEETEIAIEKASIARRRLWRLFKLIGVKKLVKKLAPYI